MTYEDNYLAHYGIRGQRWGLRRYQNEDGSLTAEGKEHYYGMSERKTNKLYDRSEKKLNKLADKADRRVQAVRYEVNKEKAKHNLKRGLVDAGIAGLGLASEHGGTLRDKNVANLVRKNSIDDIKGLQLLGEAASLARSDGTPISSRITDEGKKYYTALFGKYATYAALGAGAARLGAASVQGVKAVAAKRRLSDIGHSKAKLKYDAQLDRMQLMFNGTPYSARLKKTAQQNQKRINSSERKTVTNGSSPAARRARIQSSSRN